MKLREVILKNFRGYYAETRITIDDLTALIGKNDVGKSTILEALDIFFNQSKIDSADRNVFHTGEETVIGCVFDDLPAEITLENVTTSFSKNYIHSDVVRDLFGVQIEISDTMDVPREISALLQARNPTAYSPETVKRKLNKLGALRMTMELLHSRDPADEVIGWLRDISKFIQA